MPKLYYTIAANDGGPWQVPGKQDKGAVRVDVPSPPAELAAWLNARRVGRVPLGSDTAHELWPGEAAEHAAADASGPHVLGPATKDPPRLAPKFLGDLEGGAEFVPVAKAAEIDRLLERCPRCHGGAMANVLLWIGEASPDELQRTIEAARDRIAEIKSRLSEGGEA